MDQKITKLLALALIASAGFVQAMSNNHFMPRGFSNNMAHELNNMVGAYCDNGEEDGWHGNFMVTGSYNRSFNDKRSNGLGSMFSFGGSVTNDMSLGGGTTAGTTFNVDAYQLGMGTSDDASTLKMNLSPKVYSAGADFSLFVGANKMETGFWFKAHGAVGVMAVDPKLTESGALVTDIDYIAEMFGNATTGTRYTTVAAAFKAATAVHANYAQLKYGKIDGKQTTGAKFGDVVASLGYNFIADEDKIVGLAVRGLIPTANKPKGEYVFEPIFGHGGNWALGGEAFVKATLWSSDEDDKSLVFSLNGHASHYFKASQVRSFDSTTRNGRGSRYLLVAEYKTTVETLRSGAQAQSQDKVANLINYSTLACDSTVSVEGAVAARLDYNCGNWNMAVGGEFWGSAKEKLTITGTLNADLVVLGRQGVGRASGTSFGGLCEPAATMNSQQAFSAFTDGSGGAISTTLPLATDAAAHLKASDLDATSAANVARHSAKVFANAGHKWMDSEYCPCLGISGSAEFGTSKRNTISQWGVAVHGGICF